MKHYIPSTLSASYRQALQIHFDQGPQAGLQAAHDVGAQAGSKGLEPRDLLRVHQQTVAALLRPDWDAFKREVMSNRAELFFAEAIHSIASNDSERSLTSVNPLPLGVDSVNA